jgi:hypothetical protein
MCLLLLGDLRDPRTRILGRHDVMLVFRPVNLPDSPRAAYAKYECNHVYQTPSGEPPRHGPADLACRGRLARVPRTRIPLPSRQLTLPAGRCHFGKCVIDGPATSAEPLRTKHLITPEFDPKDEDPLQQPITVTTDYMQYRAASRLLS